jgi:hypothetical protein
MFKTARFPAHAGLAIIHWYKLITNFALTTSSIVVHALQSICKQVTLTDGQKAFHGLMLVNGGERLVTPSGENKQIGPLAGIFWKKGGRMKGLAGQ